MIIFNRRNNILFTAIMILIFIIAIQPVSSKNREGLFPEIKSLNYTDLNYRQLQEDIEFFYRAQVSGRTLPPLIFYSYTVNQEMNIFSASSQAGLPYEAIATFNHISNATDNLAGRRLIIPSQAGIFLPKKPASDLEFIALSWRSSRLSEAVELTINDIGYYFFPGESFHNVERAFFLGILFSNPLPEGIVSSGYGMRNSPFTGHASFHNGIDIAAPSGTPVFAAREGEIIRKGYNETFGNYMEISHAGGYSTFYGHLNKIFVELHDKVISTMIIAEVGSTGLSTGPHLHFEVKRDGDIRDPSQLTPGLE